MSSCAAPKIRDWPGGALRPTPRRPARLQVALRRARKLEQAQQAARLRVVGGVVSALALAVIAVCLKGRVPQAAAAAAQGVGAQDKEAGAAWLGEAGGCGSLQALCAVFATSSSAAAPAAASVAPRALLSLALLWGQLLLVTAAPPAGPRAARAHLRAAPPPIASRTVRLWTGSRFPVATRWKQPFALNLAQFLDAPAPGQRGARQGGGRGGACLYVTS